MWILKAQAMNFGAQVRAGVRISESDFRRRSRTSGAMVEAYVQMVFVLQHYAASGWIGYALLASWSFFSSAAWWVAPHSELRLFFSRALC
jgi:hypothetical protein